MMRMQLGDSQQQPVPEDMREPEPDPEPHPHPHPQPAAAAPIPTPVPIAQAIPTPVPVSVPVPVPVPAPALAQTLKAMPPVEEWWNQFKVKGMRKFAANAPIIAVCDVCGYHIPKYPEAIMYHCSDCDKTKAFCCFGCFAYPNSVQHKAPEDDRYRHDHVCVRETVKHSTMSKLNK